MPDEMDPTTVSQDALQRADRMLTHMADIAVEEFDDVPGWIVAARMAVRHLLQEGDE